MSCPFALIDDESLEAIELYRWSERGFLPEAGGINDQYEIDLQMIIAVGTGINIEDRD